MCKSTVSTLLRSLQKGFDALLFPTNLCCHVCGKESVLPDDGVCSDCRDKLRACGVLSAPPPLDGLCAAYHYDPILRPAVHSFKYKGATWRARFLMRALKLPETWQFDVVIPVPMHPLKAYRRGYNPPEALVLALEERYAGLSIRTDLLKKIKLTRSQTTLDAEGRHRNVQGVFRASSKVQGMSVLLVDDVTTTHSTLVACAAALKSQGAARIYAACACCAAFGQDATTDEYEAED